MVAIFKIVILVSIILSLFKPSFGWIAISLIILMNLISLGYAFAKRKNNPGEFILSMIKNGVVLAVMFGLLIWASI